VPPPLTLAEVDDRLKAQRSVHYLDLYNVIKGVTLGVAGVSLLALTVPDWNSGRLLQWLVAFVGAVLTYYAAVAGAALLNRRPSLPDIAFPMMLSTAEFVLIYRPSVDLGRHAEWMPTGWFAFLAAWDLLCGLVVLSVWRGMARRDEYEACLWNVVDAYRRRLIRDLAGALGTGFFVLLAVILWSTGAMPEDNRIKVAVLALALASHSYGVYSQGRSSKVIEQGLEQARRRESVKRVAGTHAR
jgi:hypothetical protein